MSCGGRLLTLYRRQLGRPGLVAVGDAVATTAPTAGRGVGMASMQIAGLLELLDAGSDPATIADAFGAWCDTWILPWVEDHLAIDAESVRRWQGHDVDLTQPLTSAAVVESAKVDARIAPHVGGFLAMTALPASLAPAGPIARAVYESGWRAPPADGPTRDELVALLTTPHAARYRAADDPRRARVQASLSKARANALSAPLASGATVRWPTATTRNECPERPLRCRRSWSGSRRSHGVRRSVRVRALA